LGRTELPASVRNLIERHLDSAAHVETLLLLCQDEGPWTAQAVARELRIDRDQAAGILDRLSRSGLLGQDGEGSFRYEPRRPKLAEAVALLARLYPTYRVAIVSEIYARPSGPIRDFSEAFRVRKDD
jgi:hypothetical protein